MNILYIISNKYSDIFIIKEILNKLFLEIGAYLIKNIINWSC